MVVVVWLDQPASILVDLDEVSQQHTFTTILIWNMLINLQQSFNQINWKWIFPIEYKKKKNIQPNQQKTVDPNTHPNGYELKTVGKSARRGHFIQTNLTYWQLQLKLLLPI